MKNRPLFQQDIALLMEAGLLNRQSYLKAYSDAVLALDQIERRAEQGEYGFLEDPFLPLDEVPHLLQRFQNFRMVLVLGSPSSSAAVRALSSLLQSWVWVDDSKPRLCFLDQPDPEIFWEVMSVANPMTTGVIVLPDFPERESTVLQLMRCLEYWQGLISRSDLKQHFLVMLSAQGGALQRIVEAFNLSSLDCSSFLHPPGQSLSCFSLPALLPVMIGGFDAKKFNQGASLTCSQFFRRQLKIPLEGASLLWAAQHLYNLKHHVLHPVGNVFVALMTWMQRLWQELLPAPPYTLGEELFSQGRHFFTLFFENHVAREQLNPDFWSPIPEVKALAHMPLEDWIAKDCQDFCKKKIQKGHLLRILKVNTLNEETLGALCMNHILETLVIKELSRTEQNKV